jgi:hypothetical protein
MEARASQGSEQTLDEEYLPAKGDRRQAGTGR